jgi:hypothetical protein
VDAETYPVADSISLGWYVGTARESANERWGFAFSSKQKWRDKFRDDVAKAVGAGRGYSKIFFVTNQFVPDKKRSEVEDQLRSKYKVDVRILDRSWILDKVFTNGHESLAINDLELTTTIREDTKVGPLDFQREQSFSAMESKITQSLREGMIDSLLVEDCLKSAGLARELERPRTTVDGLYQRASNVADSCQSVHQRLKCAYQWAWTTFWWYEDYRRFEELYETAERYVTQSKNSYELELLSNLWTLLHSAVVRNAIDSQTSSLQSHTEKLFSGLNTLSKEENRPSTALHARTIRLQMQLVLHTAANKPLGSLLREFQQIITSCQGLAGFPFQPLVEILTELGTFITEQPEYDELFETILRINKDRKADLAAARMLVNRSAQLLKVKRYRDVIRTSGLAMAQLYKHESREDIVKALYFCANAYEQLDLLWAARGTLLSAASIAAQEFWQHERATKLQVACYRAIKWLELKLGRVAQVLSWHEVDVTTTAAFARESQEGKEIELSTDIAFDASLGAVLLRADV